VGWAAHFFVVLTGVTAGVTAGCIIMSNIKLEQLVAPELETLGFECVKIEVVGSSRSPVVRLYIDKPGGVSIGDCSLVSRTIGLLLEKEDPFPGRYLLEVSSPGSDRPLVTEEHFQRFAGEEARVQVKPGPESPEKITYTGQIRSCINGLLTLETGDGVAVEIELSNILKASLVGQDYKIDKKQKRSKRDKGAERAERGPRSERGGKRKGDQK
jgi:ribosome maturation factor RimP